MLKTALLVVAGLVAGLAIAFWLQPSPEPSAEAVAANGVPSLARSDASPIRAPRARENAYNRRGPAPFEFIDSSRRAVASTPEQLAVDLIVAGFAPDRAEWINRRVQELRMEAMPDVEAATLRTGRGDQDYERFLAARGVPTSVNIMRVFASSPAERAGMQRGDEIFSYDGKRVFNVQDLNELALGGTRGEPVVVDLRRNGENLRIVLPRGPIGIWGGHDLRSPPPGLQR